LRKAEKAKNSLKKAENGGLRGSAFVMARFAKKGGKMGGISEV
jgi:hypothetical protein